MIRAYEILTKPRKPLSDLEIIEQVRHGLPISAISNLSHALSMSKENICNVLGLSARTMSRRQVFKKEEADKLFRVARVLALAINVLEDSEHAIEWLNTPKLALDHQTPLSLLDTEIGAREVEKLLKRIEYGVYT